MSSGSFYPRGNVVLAIFNGSKIIVFIEETSDTPECRYAVYLTNNNIPEDYEHVISIMCEECAMHIYREIE